MNEELSNIEDAKSAEELMNKINGIIERLINKDAILIVTNDNDDRAERTLSVNVQYGIPYL